MDMKSLLSDYVVVDIETDDPGLRRGSGSSWPIGNVSFLVGGTYSERDGYKTWKHPNTLIEYLQQYSHIIGHNLTYDVGVLSQFGFDFEKFVLIDTMILAKLYDNRYKKYGLDSLANVYLGTEKQDEELGEIAKRLGLVKSTAQNPVSVAKINMQAIFDANPSAVENYVISDVNLTLLLYQIFNIARQTEIEFYSDLQKALFIARKRGVRVDVRQARKIKKLILEKEDPLRVKIACQIPGINLNSTKQLAEVFKSLGIEVPVAKKGGPSVTSEWLESLDLDLAKDISKVKKCEKLRRDFVEPIIEEFGNQDYGVIHPEIKILGAAATGRASASGPNIQQIPKRDKEFGSLIRSIYVPHEGEKWYSLDFSAQEPRMQVHYANLLGCKGARTLVEAYKKDSRLDLHSLVAEVIGTDRSVAKTINLGLAYGMGDKKLAAQLKVSLEQAKQYKAKLSEKMPYLMQLDKISKKVIKERGYVLTVSRRKLYNEPGFESKALNKLIQGSAADQTWSAIVEAYRQGIKILFPVHDELNISAPSVINAVTLQQIMQTVIPLSVPSVTDIMVGYSWGDLKPYEKWEKYI